MTIKGTIEKIEYRTNNAHEKKVVTVRLTHKQCAFVEFRGRGMNMLDSCKKGDEVEIMVELDGRISPKSGVEYNNIVGTRIRRFDYNQTH